jgi:hypothetical protein
MTHGDAPIPQPGRGGKRPGAGRPPASKSGPEASDDSKLYNASRARKEAAEANLKELQFKVETGLHVARISVVEASATALSNLAQSLRSVPDTLERKGLEPRFCVMVGEAVDAALLEVSELFEMMAGPEPDAG